MCTLILVRHSITKPTPQVNSHAWQLTDKGRQRCRALADKLAPYAPPKIITSHEPKAIETGALAARYLNVPHHSAPGLHEQERDNIGLFPTQEAFQGAVEELFRCPNDLVFGKETATQAQTRFSQAVDAVIEGQPQGNVVIVSHGTVITLFTARRAKIDPIPFWKSLGMPALITFSLPSLELKQVLNNV